VQLRRAHRCKIRSASSDDTSRDQPCAVLKAMTRAGLLWPIDKVGVDSVPIGALLIGLAPGAAEVLANLGHADHMRECGNCRRDGSQHSFQVPFTRPRSLEQSSGLLDLLKKLSRQTLMRDPK
jgi:hypothetical protein